MSVIRWLAHVIRAVYRLVFWSAIALALFVVSASMAGTENAGGVPFVRGLAALMLYTACWSFVTSGVLRRPPSKASTQKPTGAEVLRSSIGCVAHLAVLVAVFFVAGAWTDEAWAGYQNPASGHPARQWVAWGSGLITMLVEQPDTYGPFVFGGLVAVLVSYRILSAMAGPGPTAAGGATTPPVARKRRGRRGAGVAEANERALEQARQAARRQATRADVPANAGSTRAVTTAHEGAHRTAPVPRHPTHDLSAARNADAVLGAMAWIDDAWWARRDGDRAPIRIDAPRSGPTPAQMDLARAAAMRDFELTLRASDAARPVAIGRGVGLPRFTTTAIVIGADRGAATTVTVYLRCEGDAGHDYAVQSTDGMQRFQLPG